MIFIRYRYMEKRYTSKAVNYQETLCYETNTQNLVKPFLDMLWSSYDNRSIQQEKIRSKGKLLHSNFKNLKELLRLYLIYSKLITTRFWRLIWVILSKAFDLLRFFSVGSFLKLWKVYFWSRFYHFVDADLNLIICLLFVEFITFLVIFWNFSWK